MMDLHEIKEKLTDRRRDKVAEATGLSVSTIATIKDGRNSNPTYAVLKALSDYLEGAE